VKLYKTKDSSYSSTALIQPMSTKMQSSLKNNCPYNGGGHHANYFEHGQAKQEFIKLTAITYSNTHVVNCQ